MTAFFSMFGLHSIGRIVVAMSSSCSNVLLFVTWHRAEWILMYVETHTIPTQRWSNALLRDRAIPCARDQCPTSLSKSPSATAGSKAIIPLSRATRTRSDRSDNPACFCKTRSGTFSNPTGPRSPDSGQGSCDHLATLAHGAHSCRR